MVTEVRKSAPGAVKKLSVAVIVDSTTAKVDNAQLQQLISSAVGLDPQRGDMIAVSSMAFDQSAAEANADAIAGAQSAAANEIKQQYIQMGLIAGAILVLVIIAAISGRRRRKKDREQLTAEANAALEEMQNAIEQARIKLALDAGGGSSGSGGGGDGSPPDDGAVRDARQKDLTALVEKQPDEVAQLLRGWLADRRS
jgi:flagellar M-ring protein FliF